MPLPAATEVDADDIIKPDGWPDFTGWTNRQFEHYKAAVAELVRDGDTDPPELADIFCRLACACVQHCGLPPMPVAPAAGASACLPYGDADDLGTLAADAVRRLAFASQTVAELLRRAEAELPHGARRNRVRKLASDALRSGRRAEDDLSRARAVIIGKHTIPGGLDPDTGQPWSPYLPD